MRHLSEKQVAAAALGFADDAAQHAAHCTSCGLRLAQTAAVLRLASSMEAPPMRPGVADCVLARIAQSAPRPSRGHGMAWAAALATAAVLLAIGVGRLVRPHAPASVPAAAARTAAPRPSAPAVLVAASDHLDRSQALLTELAHSQGPSPRLQSWASDLLASNRLLEQGARTSGDAELAQLLDELEATLLQVSHAPDDATGGQWRALRARLAASGILFKVRIVDETLQNRITLQASTQHLDTTL